MPPDHRILLDHCFIHQTVMFTPGCSLDPETVKAGSIAQSGDTEQNLSMKPPPHTGALRAGNCSNLTALHLFPWLCSPSSHPQSILATHTPKNSHLIYLNSVQNSGSQEYVKPFCCAAAFPRAKLQTAPKCRFQSREEKKNIYYTLEILLFHWLPAGFCPG